MADKKAIGSSVEASNGRDADMVRPAVVRRASWRTLDDRLYSTYSKRCIRRDGMAIISTLHSLLYCTCSIQYHVSLPFLCFDAFFSPKFLNYIQVLFNLNLMLSELERCVLKQHVRTQGSCTSIIWVCQLFWCFCTTVSKCLHKSFHVALVSHKDGLKNS